MILALIAACEIAFWVVIAVGLGLRYAARRPRAGMATLSLVPLVDVVLLAGVAIHLSRGGTATLAHGLAAFYLGFSLAYGHRLIAWADRHVAYRFADGPRPRRLVGSEHVRLCWGDVRRTGLACGLAAALSWALITFVGDPTRTAALADNYRWAAFIVGIEVLVAISYTVWPRSEATPARA